MGRLLDRIAVVTGGGRGIGRAIALRFAREGATVIISSRTKAELDLVIAEIKSAGGDGLAVVADAMDRASARKPIERALSQFGQIDVLVNNVGGVIGSHSSLDGGDESFEATLLLNLTSPWWTSTAALPAMKARGFGRIINIGSTESLRANAGCPPAYVASKHGIAGLTKQLAQDAGAAGITVNSICPGWTNTSMVDFGIIGQYRCISADDARAYAASKSALNCILEPDEIASMAMFLASEEGARITGQIISVDGGYRL